MSVSPKLERENRIALMVVQAFLGLVSRNVVAISVDPCEPVIVLHLWVSEVNPELEEDAQEATAELEAMFVREDPSIRTEFHLGSPPPDWPKWAGRMIYWAKDGSAD